MPPTTNKKPMRIILDIANKDNPKQVLDALVKSLDNETVSAVCIDETNENQFHEDMTQNVLSKKQIKTYKNYCFKEAIFQSCVEGKSDGWGSGMPIEFIGVHGKSKDIVECLKDLKIPVYKEDGQWLADVTVC